MSWLREYVDIPASTPARDIAALFISMGFEVESIETPGSDVSGSLVIGKVMAIEELTEFKKPIRFCQVDVGLEHGGIRGIVCGARNFTVGDVVVAAIPGAVLPGNFAIVARETYGKISDGMLCSERELGLGDDHAGIIVLSTADAEIGDIAIPVLGLGDPVLDIAVNPDRGYAMSARGLARELALAMNLPFRDPAFAIDSSNAFTSEGGVPAQIHDTRCSRLVATSMSDVDCTASTPRWMRNRLIAGGLRPVSVVVDITNYVMLELGQPLHAYDAQQVAGVLVARAPNAGEVLETLDHQKRTLDIDDLVIADQERVLGLAGVMGGVNSEISAATRSVILEAAHFEGSAVAGMCRRHGFSTEASRRFERGVDPAITKIAAERAWQLLSDLTGARRTGQSDAGSIGQPHRIQATSDGITGRSGLSATPSEVVDVLSRIGCMTELLQDADDLPTDGTFDVIIPSWRPDLQAECDLTEEFARIVGYDSIPSIFPVVPAGAALTSMQKLRRGCDLMLTDLGWVQVMTSPFMDAGALTSWQLSQEDSRARLVRVANPMSDENPFMRSTLLPSLFAVLERNRGRGFDSAAVFERSATHQGRVASVASPPTHARPDVSVLATLDDALPTEIVVASGAAFGEHTCAGVFGKGRNWQWSDAVDAALSLCRVAGVSASATAASLSPWHPGRCASIVVTTQRGDVVVGHAGEIHPRVTESFGGPAGVVAFEVDVDALAALAAEQPWPSVGEPLPTSAVVKEAVALVVPSSVPASAVQKALRDGCGPMLEEVRLFDRYVGEQVPSGHVSLAFDLRFRHPERTLTDEEVAQMRAEGIANATRITGALLRGASS